LFWGVFNLSSCENPEVKEPVFLERNYLGILLLDEEEGIELPFQFNVRSKDSVQYQWEIINGEERILIDSISSLGDSIYVQMPVFESYFVLIETDGFLEGYWKDPSRGDYRIPFKAFPWEGARFRSEHEFSEKDFWGSWKVKFSPKTENESLAIGNFYQDSVGRVTGNFQTEMGDYRFLDGQLIGETLYLSCFDGSHAFLFTAVMSKGGRLYGSFYSGNHWTEKWRALRDPDFRLREMHEITQKVNSEPFALTLRDSLGDAFDFATYRDPDKVYLMQILGSWCPNCMDESRYFQELQEKYGSQGLQVIGFAYERHTEKALARNAIDKMTRDLELDYPIFHAGKANKQDANADFAQLDTIISFPTSVLLNRRAEIKWIHSGFNGPGTGADYKQYTRDFERLLLSVLNDASLE